MNSMDMTVSRRGVLGGSAKLAAASAVTVPMMGLMSRQAMAAGTGQLAPVPSPYGPIAPVKDLNTGLFLLQLPKGFSYRSFSWTGDLMNDGQRVLPRHDGMGVVKTMRVGRGTDQFLIRNHENGLGPIQNVVGNPGAIYDTATDTNGNGSWGGCDVLRVRNGQLIDHRQTIAGTVINCAGGITGWGTWLTCEEFFTGTALPTGFKKHGYVFECSANPMETVATPIVGMGRFSHEATARDPVTGYVYETEDDRNKAGFYRYKPNNTSMQYGALAQGGTLQAAKVVGLEGANLIALGGAQPKTPTMVGQEFEIEWVDIENPDADAGTTNDTGFGSNAAQSLEIRSAGASGPYLEARSKGALRMCRGEGIWWATNSMFIVDTNFGYSSDNRPGRGLGAIWEYTPSRTNPERGTLKLIYTALARVAGNNPDNITVSPRGGLLTCDDGAAAIDAFGEGQRLMGYSAAGEAYIFGKNNAQLSPTDIAGMGRSEEFIEATDHRDNEFCGACFDPTGRTLFVNMQTPGITFAISGPWARGNL
jgi:uncharacterized protein